MKVRIVHKTHQYYIDDNMAEYSVTEILQNQGIAPNYDTVSDVDMKKAISRGNKIHKDIDKTFRVSGYEPKTSVGKQFYKWYKENCQYGCSEQLVGINWKGIRIGGCIDFLALNNDGDFIVGDHKTTSVFHEEYVSWQVSIYDYMLRKIGTGSLNNIVFNWTGAKKFYCFWYKGDEFKVKELKKIDDVEIEKLLDAVYNGVFYQRPLLVVDKELARQVQEIEHQLISKQAEIKALQDKQQELESKLLEHFEKQGIKTWETPDKKLQVTYVAPSERITVDSTALRRDLPMVWGKYQKISKVKAQLRITLREQE